MAIHDLNHNSPIFILGAPRSGTTFLASLLKHTEYGAPFETHFITKYYKKLLSYGDLTDHKNFTRLLSDILKERPVMQWHLDLDLMEFYESLNGEIEYRKVVDELCSIAARKKGYSGWGDKTPHYIADLEIVYKLFPESKYIYIVRDGRDVALSLLEKSWGPNNIYSCAKYWAALNRGNEYLEKIKSSGNLFQLRYEDLVEDKLYYVRELYNFLGIQYYDDKVAESLPPVKKDNCFKWKTKLTKRQVDIFDGIASEALSKFGYEVQPGVKMISPIMAFLYKIHDGFHKARHLFVINVIDAIRIRFFGMQPFDQ